MSDDFEERLKKIETSVDKVTQAVGTLANHIQTPPKEEGGGKKPKSEEFDVDSLDDNALENMSRKELLKLIAKMTDSRVNNVVGDLSGKLEETEGRISEADLKAELKEALQKHPELPHFGPELKKMIQDNPGLSVERMVNLIKLENPKKLEKVQQDLAKAKEGKDEGEGDEKPGKEEEKPGDKGTPPKKGTGGGLPPSGGGTGAAPTAEGGKMSMEEAVRASMAEVGFTTEE